jgi:hypothetical protein
MEFSVLCPTDGPVEVGLQHIESIVVREGDTVDVHFVCPCCGGDIRVSAQVPHMLIAALDETWAASEDAGDDGAVRLTRGGGIEPVGVGPEGPGAPNGEAVSAEERERIERYVEYFHRQLAATDTAEAMLSEIDQH